MPKRRISWWIGLGVLQFLLLAGALAYRPLSIAYYSYRLRNGNAEAADKLAAFGPAAVPALVNAVAGMEVWWTGPVWSVAGDCIDPPHLLTVGAYEDACEALVKIGDPAKKALLEAAANEEPHSKRYARLCRALAYFPGKEARRAYLEVFRSPNTEVWNILNHHLRSPWMSARLFLISRQEEDGRWSAKEWGAVGASDEEVTALATLAIWSMDFGKYNEESLEADCNVSNIWQTNPETVSGVRYLMEAQQPDGRIGSDIRTHLLASLVLSEATIYEVSGAREHFKKAVRYAMNARNSSGLWPTSGKDEVDPILTALGTVLMRNATWLEVVDSKEAMKPLSDHWHAFLPKSTWMAIGLRDRKIHLHPTRENLAFGFVIGDVLKWNGGNILLNKSPLKLDEIMRDPWLGWAASGALFHESLSPRHHDQNWLKKIGSKQIRSVPLRGGWKPASPEERRLGLIGTTALRLMAYRRGTLNPPFWFKPKVKWNQWMWDEAAEEKRSAKSRTD